MSEQGVPVTIVNHVAIDIAATPEAVWEAILDEYVEAKKFRELGYTIEPLDDPAAVLGGYRMRFEQDGVVIDDRTCRFTERNEIEHRLSIFADYRIGGLIVYATYQAQRTGAGSRYAIDCHSTMTIDPPASDDPAAMMTATAELKSQFDAALLTYLSATKAKLERTP